MGNARFSADDYSSYNSQHTVGKSTAQVFSNRSMSSKVDPKNFTAGMRESVDSTANPRSTPIAIFCDQTGSMGHLADEIIRRGLGVIATSLYDTKPVSDPHILVGAIGDAFNRESAPIQASQFEADAVALASQTQELYLEGNGGGNGGESYSLAHLFASRMTTHDAWNKRKEKGFLFTIGDEHIHGGPGARVQYGVTKDQAKLYMGIDLSEDMTAEQILAETLERWEVFHIDVKGQRLGTWQELLGDRLISITNVDALAEVISSTIQVVSGYDPKKVAASWGGSKAMVVADAIKGLRTTGQSAGAVARL